MNIDERDERPCPDCGGYDICICESEEYFDYDPEDDDYDYPSEISMSRDAFLWCEVCDDYQPPHTHITSSGFAEGWQLMSLDKPFTLFAIGLPLAGLILIIIAMVLLLNRRKK